jgi:hypothetical protein
MSGITKKSATGVHHRGYSIEQAIRKTDKFATIAAEVILDWFAPIGLLAVRCSDGENSLVLCENSL